MLVKTLAIVPILVGTAGPDVHAEIAAIADRFIGLRVLASDDLYAADPEAARTLADCAADVACLSERLRRSGAELGLVAVINTALDPPVIALRLVDAKAGTVVASVSEGGDLRARTKTLLLRAGFVETAELELVVVPANAELTIDEDPPLEAHDARVLRLAPGPHRVRARLEGYVVGDRVVEAKSGERTKVDLILASEEPSSVVSSGWFWAIVGSAAAIGATVAIVAATRSDRCICVGPADQPCPSCD